MLMYKIVLLFLLNAVIADDDEIIEKVADSRPSYSTPAVPENAYFAETFDSKNDFATWTVSSAKKDDVDQEISKYNGRWDVVPQNENALNGDMGLLLKDKARHHAISKKLIRPFIFDDAEQFVLQYEVNFQQGIECGGGYIKLLSQHDDLDLLNFRDKTAYTIMFGPDKCGEDYKLHFIFRHKNPKTGEFEEKHAKKPATDLKGPYGDKSSHLYTLVVNGDNSFIVYLDQKEINRGNLLEDVTPPVNPPAEVEDKDDKKPEEWDEREKIPDPEATKPDDWDEDAPAKILDPNAEMPDGWLEEEPTYVDDPEAERPEDWDDEMDGEWEAPKIENPKCTDGPGCGLWEPPMISNPEFKGKWRPKLISNPNYKGIWKPRMIPNPNYFEDLNPFRMTSIDAVGLELWSMSAEIMFDNILITNDKSEADTFAEQTWKLKRIVYNTNEAGIFQGLLDATNERPWLWAIYILVIGLPIILIFTFCCSGKKTEDSKKTDEPTPDDPHDEEEEKEEESKEDDKEEESGDASVDKTNADGDAAPASKADLEEDEDDASPEPEDENNSQDEQSARRTSPRKRRQRKD